MGISKGVTTGSAMRHAGDDGAEEEGDTGAD